jgi:transcriptional regulator with XRE-family HTH domain
MSDLSAPAIRRRELAEFLRSRRARLTPAEVGLPEAGIRRTPGLRREEVAMLAGVGITWYTWLEQGRKINPSDDVLASIARTLRLSSAETDHVFRLAKPQRTNGVTKVPEVLRHLVASFDPAPAILIDARWDLLGWSRAAEELYRIDKVRVEDRNAAILMFDQCREVVEDWPAHARRMIGAIRAASADLLDDDRFLAVLEQLRRDHPEMSQWWDEPEVAPKTVSCKVLLHPVRGRMPVSEVVLRPAVAPELQLVINFPWPVA